MIYIGVTKCATNTEIPSCICKLDFFLLPFFSSAIACALCSCCCFFSFARFFANEFSTRINSLLPAINTLSTLYAHKTHCYHTVHRMAFVIPPTVFSRTSRKFHWQFSYFALIYIMLRVEWCLHSAEGRTYSYCPWEKPICVWHFFLA